MIIQVKDFRFRETFSRPYFPFKKQTLTNCFRYDKKEHSIVSGPEDTISMPQLVRLILDEFFLLFFFSIFALV